MSIARIIDIGIRSTWMGLLLASSAAGAAGVVACKHHDDSSTNGRIGQIDVTNTNLAIEGTSKNGYSATAEFTDFDLSPAPEATCESDVFDAHCSYRKCKTEAAADAGAQAAPKPASPGPITIRGGALPAGFQLVPDDRAKYPRVSGLQSLWSSGDDIQISADGRPGEVEAFSRTVKAPTLIAITMPAWPASEPAPSIDRDKDLEVAWQSKDRATDDTDVKLNLSAASSGDTYRIQCRYGLAENEGRIPAPMLTKLPAGSAAFSVSTESGDIVYVKGWSLLMQLHSIAVREGGAAAGQAILR